MYNTFPKSISLKVNVKAQLEFELGYFQAGVKHFGHYATGTPHRLKDMRKRKTDKKTDN